MFPLIWFLRQCTVMHSSLNHHHASGAGPGCRSGRPRPLARHCRWLWCPTRQRHPPPGNRPVLMTPAVGQQDTGVRQADAHTHTHTSTHTYVRIHTHSNTHTLKHTRTHTLARAHTHTHSYWHPHIYMRICTHSHTHTYTHWHTHTHTGTHKHTHTEDTYTHMYTCLALERVMSAYLLRLGEWGQLTCFTLECKVSLPASPWSARSAYLLHLGVQGQLTCFTLECKVSLPASP